MELLPSLVEQTINTYGRLDILINNASSYYPTEIGKMNEKNWNDLIGSNLKAPLFLSQLAANQLIKTKGCIINITDTHIDKPKKNYIIYSIAKSGLTTLTKSLAQELSPDVRVNAVAPGPVLWPENNEEFNDIYKQRVISQTLLKKMGTPEDVAMAVKFLVLDAPFITGHILAVDGGRSLSL
jgi:pteridine reductase